jgi:hypothetical protein
MKGFLVFIQVAYLGLLVFVFEDDLRIAKNWVYAHISDEYEKDVQLVEPYFDEEFYMQKYGDAVLASGLSPIDHFLQRGGHSKDWRHHTDPNHWFNTTLIQERLWPGGQSKHPFIDFLTQPKIDTHSETVEVYACSNELSRAWYAVEGFLRQNKFNVHLHLPVGLSQKELIRFIPQVKRGLVLTYDNQKNKSFYQSSFLKFPQKYKVTDMTPEPKINLEQRITYVHQDFDYLMHRLYNPLRWYQRGKLNPMMINIAHYNNEPLMFARFGDKTIHFKRFAHNLLAGEFKYPDITAQDFKDYMTRIGEGFDLCMLNTKLPLTNLKIVPGFIYVYVDENELNPSKKFEVSLLLSLGGKSFSFYRKKEIMNYAKREETWEREGEFKIPTLFYLSYRDKDKYSKDLQKRVIPSFSKKWVFNSQYNIAIENTQQEDYLSEKLLDCFVAKTVPVYIGCPNVGDYFDTRGMIIVNNVDELIDTCNQLTPEVYAQMLPYIEENYKRAHKMLNLENEIIQDFGKRLNTDS